MNIKLLDFKIAKMDYGKCLISVANAKSFIYDTLELINYVRELTIRM